ncbi:hypothetical protein ABZX40_26010 [Streptomyces sp. NPDC004610]|uniref:hypothetical protein n=1 Tax=unclassified Streptomyces TaxID=2593676 RepID=UPI0033A24953
MLRIIDARTGHPADAAPVRRGLTRVEVHADGHDTTALRVLLVADVLVRALELGGTPVWAQLGGAADQTELRADAAALGVRPFEESRDVGQALGAAQVIHVAAGEGPAGGTAEGALVGVAPVDPVTGPPPGTDPAALRLALVSVRHDRPARVDPAALDTARGTLSGWRRAVADWARTPSRPIPADVRNRLRAAWEDDLDVPGVLDVLRGVADDPGVPDGARFETFAYADRLLGVELTRDVGAQA